MPGPINHTPGKHRYLTVWLIFPGDHDRWVDQITFAQPLDNFLKHTKLKPIVKNELIRKGESTQTDKNGMKFHFVIEEVERPRKWGIDRNTKLH